MDTYLVRRRAVAADANALDAALVRLQTHERLRAALGLRWLQAYALREADGGFGLACVLQAADLPAVRRHALAVRLPSAEIVCIAATRIARAYAPSRVWLVRRRGGFADAAALDAALAAAGRAADAQRPPQLSWLHSHLLREDDGSWGSCCFWQAVDAAALAAHARRTGLPADETTPTLGRVVARHADRPDAFTETTPCA